MATKIRLIRVLEYEFPDACTAQEHVSKMWVPLNGSKVFGITTIRSAAVMNLCPEEVKEYNGEGT